MINRNFFFYFPAFIFVFIWIAVFVVYQVNPFPFHYIHTETIIIIVSSILTVLLGFFFYRVIFGEDKFGIRKDECKSTIDLNYRFLTKALIILCLIISASLIYNVKILAEEAGGIEEYFSNPILSRQLVNETKKQVASEWNPLLSLAGYGVNLIVLSSIIGGMLFSSRSVIQKLISFLPLLFAILVSLVYFSRYVLFSTISFWILSSFYYSLYLKKTHRNQNIRNLAILSVFSSIVFLSLTYLIVNLRHFTSGEIGELFIFQLYSYIIGNIVGLDKFFLSDYELLWGLGIFNSVLKWLARIGLVEENLVDISSPFTNIGLTVTNTYSYVKSFFVDFGLVGLWILSFVWGNLTAFISSKFIHHFSFSKLFWMVVFTFSLFMSFYGFYLSSISTIIYWLITIKIFETLFMKRIYN